MERRDSPGIEPEPASDAPSSPRRRFARMVDSPTARRLALPRLIIAGGLTLALAVLVVVGVARFIKSAVEWVEQRPERQIPFSGIELEPPPPRWIKGGAPLILEEVRVGAKLGETVPLLELDLKQLDTAFRLCFWVKDVIQVDRSHFNRLIVRLAYRKPLAFVKLERGMPNAFAVDDEAVVLPYEGIDWTSERPPIQVRGIADPLIEIRGLPASTPPPPRFGVPWKRTIDGDALDDGDPIVLRAAKLAGFLLGKRSSTKAPDTTPAFASIRLPGEPGGSFFLLDSGDNWVRWGKAPGDEKPGDPSSEARWAMLLAWIQANGPLHAKGKKFLDLTDKGAKINEPEISRKKPTQSRD